MGVLLIWIASVVASTRMSYPGSSVSTDPTGSWSIEWLEATQDTPHRLLLKDRKTDKVVPLYEFDRHVDVLWAPDGTAVAITDYAGSNESLIYVIHPNKPSARIDIEQSLIATLGNIPALYENGHRYFEAIKWLRPTILRFRIHAYDAHPGVLYQGVFEFNLRTGKVHQVKRR